MSGICAAVDGTEHARGIIDWALRQAVTTGESLTVLEVLSIPMVGVAEGTGTPFYDDSTLADARGEVQAMIDEVAATVAGASAVQITPTIQVGLPATVIVEQSKSFGHLVIGAHSGLLHHMFTGSVSHAVVDHAPCPVTVVPSSYTPAVALAGGGRALYA